MKFIVCDTDNKQCMTRRCENCPKSSDLLIQYLDEDFEIKFSQWTTVDRSTLIQHEESISEYVEMVVKQLQDLTSHSYIAKSQAKYLNDRKNEINETCALILGDFAENYSFVVQDEVQGFHWNNLQCTLHPVVCYFKSGNDLDHASHCIISDDNSHDVPTVYEIQKKIISDLKIRLPNLEKVEYFSDGCAAQYKNRINFINLCMHQSDLGLNAKWSFFATSHGKQPCDGIGGGGGGGGAVKRLASKKSATRK